MSIDEWVSYGIPDDVIEQATEWIAKLDSERVTLEQRNEVMHWLDEDPTHRWAFEALAEIWAKTSLLQDTEHLIEQSQVLHFPSPTVAYHENNLPGRTPLLPLISLFLIFFGLIVPNFL